MNSQGLPGRGRGRKKVNSLPAFQGLGWIPYLTLSNLVSSVGTWLPGSSQRADFL